MTRKRLRTAIPFAAFATIAMLVGACGDLTGPESPSTPTGVTATLTTPTSATITWTPSPLNDGVISYSVFRNGSKVGESTTTTYVDSGLSPQATYVYSIAANCKSGIVSDRSEENAASTVTTVDLTPPTVIANQPPTNFNGVSPSATATVTFSENMNPTTINTTSFTLRVTGGATIPGTVTYNQATRVAEFDPTGDMPNPVNITASITNAARDLAGNAATPFSWAFTTRDATGPTVTATTPAAGATGVAPTTAVSITFSEPLDANTVNATNITMRVTSSSAAVPGTVAFNPTTRVATFTPTATLAQTTGYTVTVSGVRDAGGNAMTAPFTFAFTTGDTNAPSVTAVVPANNAPSVAVSSSVIVTFSEAMDATSITTATVTLRNTTTSAAVTGTVTYNPGTFQATFTPAGPLSNSTNYTFTVTTGVRDANGNPMAAPFNSTFTTVALADVIPPSVVSRTPTNGATGQAITTNATVTFNETMDATTINSTNITLTPTAGGSPIAATVTCNSPCTTATLDPTPSLASNTSYTLNVTIGVKDVAGNALAAPSPSTFTTAPDVTAPTVIARTPTAATGVPVNTTVTFTFSEAMDPATLNGTTITLNVTAGAAVTGSVVASAGNTVATFTPSAALLPNTSYTATVTTGARDVAGNALTGNFTFTFTTAP